MTGDRQYASDVGIPDDESEVGDGKIDCRAERED